MLDLLYISLSEYKPVGMCGVRLWQYTCPYMAWYNYRVAFRKILITMKRSKKYSDFKTSILTYMDPMYNSNDNFNNNFVIN